MKQVQLIDIAGIGPATAELLIENGITSAEALLGLPAEQLAAVPGFGPKRALAVRLAAARSLQGSSGGRTELESQSSGVVAQTGKKKKKKKRSKDKKSKKKSKKKDRGEKKKRKKGKKGKGKKRK
jgi:hypothetical protein